MMLVGLISSEEKFEGICNSLIVPDINKHGRDRLMKSDVSGPKMQIKRGYCETTTQSIPFSALHDANSRNRE